MDQGERRYLYNRNNSSSGWLGHIGWVVPLHLLHHLRGRGASEEKGVTVSTDHEVELLHLSSKSQVHLQKNSPLPLSLSYILVASVTKSNEDFNGGVKTLQTESFSLYTFHFLNLNTPIVQI